MPRAEPGSDDRDNRDVAIQQEIVNIPDKFTQLDTEPEAEPEARRKQY